MSPYYTACKGTSRPAGMDSYHNYCFKKALKLSSNACGVRFVTSSLKLGTGGGMALGELETSVCNYWHCGPIILLKL